MTRRIDRRRNPPRTRASHRRRDEGLPMFWLLLLVLVLGSTTYEARAGEPEAYTTNCKYVYVNGQSHYVCDYNQQPRNAFQQQNNYSQPRQQRCWYVYVNHQAVWYCG